MRFKRYTAQNEEERGYHFKIQHVSHARTMNSHVQTQISTGDITELQLDTEQQRHFTQRHSRDASHQKGRTFARVDSMQSECRREKLHRKIIFKGEANFARRSLAKANQRSDRLDETETHTQAHRLKSGGVRRLCHFQNKYRAERCLFPWWIAEMITVFRR